MTLGNYAFKVSFFFQQKVPLNRKPSAGCFHSLNLDCLNQPVQPCFPLRKQVQTVAKHGAKMIISFVVSYIRTFLELFPVAWIYLLECNHEAEI